MFHEEALARLGLLHHCHLIAEVAHDPRGVLGALFGGSGARAELFRAKSNQVRHPGGALVTQD